MHSNLGFYLENKGTPESDVVRGSVANGGTGDLRLQIGVQDGRFSLKGQEP